MSSSTQDEFGTPWLVKAGDPANPLILALTRRGFTLVILPRLWYTTGKTDSRPDFEPGDPVLAARMADCIGVLTDQAIV